MMKAKISAAPMARPITPARTASAPRSAPTVFCSITFSGAGSAPDFSSSASWVALSMVKLPVIWPWPPMIGSDDPGAEITLLSSTMAKRWPTFSVVTWPKRWAPGPLRRNSTTGVVGLLVEALLGVGQHARRRPRRALDHDEARRLAWSLRRAAPRRPAARRWSASCGAARVSSTIWKVSLAVWPIDVLQLLRIALAGRLDGDPVGALLADVGLLGAQEVDPAADDLDRLGDGVAASCCDRRRAISAIWKLPAGVMGDQHLAPAAGDRAADLGERGRRGLDLARIGDLQRDDAAPWR